MYLIKFFTLIKSFDSYFMLLLLYHIQKRTGNIGGADGEETFDDDAYALLALVAGYYACHACELTFSDAHLLALLESLYRFGCDHDVVIVGGADNFQIVHSTSKSVSV